MIGIFLLVALVIVGVIGAILSIFQREDNGPWNAPEA